MDDRLRAGRSILLGARLGGGIRRGRRRHPLPRSSGPPSADNGFADAYMDDRGQSRRAIADRDARQDVQRSNSCEPEFFRESRLLDPGHCRMDTRRIPCRRTGRSDSETVVTPCPASRFAGAGTVVGGKRSYKVETTPTAGVSRRTVLTGLASAATTALVPSVRAQTKATHGADPDVIVIGAGVFGAWTS